VDRRPAVLRRQLRLGEQRQPLDAVVEGQRARQRANPAVVDPAGADDGEPGRVAHVAHRAEQPGESLLLGELADEQQQVGLVGSVGLEQVGEHRHRRDRHASSGRELLRPARQPARDGSHRARAPRDVGEQSPAEWKARREP
jgi:hypothetical protein